MTELACLATAEDLVVRWEVREGDTAAQRLHRRPGARTWPEVVARWPPEAQRALRGDRAGLAGSRRTAAVPPLVTAVRDGEAAAVTTTPLSPTGTVAAAAGALAAQQDRVAGLLARAAGHSGPLSPEARRRLVALGHFPAYAGELDWTPWEVAGHLRDSARVFTDRIGRLLREPRPVLADFVPDTPDRVAGYRATPPAVLVAELAAAQAGLLRAVATVAPDRLGAAGVHGTDGPVTLADLLAFLPAHQRDHAEQLAALLGD
ncbi:DinB superfamily protein [Geodermatophilus dictyosporus]|uniref:DinB superfamily protein n=1 Tax=Geodermatophilus dictyosporus TaxID=1523247 RepID=A0A1I5PFH4_9ACTN|nr:DinB family protein [Geodermatophilus dictyosporus]SFP32617.1 DinB superfamily protein [Geodermatophilus dictyosporus]